MRSLPEEDLLHIFRHTSNLWEEVRGKSIFITGGTGFFGKWLVESFLFANKKLDLNANITLLTRNSQKFRADYPHLALHPSVSMIEGDITNFPFPSGNFDFAIHSAIDYKEDSLALFDSCVNGTRCILEFVKQSGANKFLLVSSGAVYGKQPDEISHIPESYNGSPDPMALNVAYGMAKRKSEYLACEYAKRFGFQVKIARCFAFLGPYLPLDKGSAIGNFIRDALLGHEIMIQGDGTPLRSYMYASDLTIWLWKILFMGVSCRAYNVGSEEEISISDLASEVVSILDPKLKVLVLKPKNNSMQPERYVPSVERAKNELSLEILVTRKNSILKTAEFNKY
ncbi:MAG: NAD-dependent epimerase/dehydratase family protein [Bacteroidales bacterium]